MFDNCQHLTLAEGAKFLTPERASVEFQREMHRDQKESNNFSHTKEIRSEMLETALLCYSGFLMQLSY